MSKKKVYFFLVSKKIYGVNIFLSLNNSFLLTLSLKITVYKNVSILKR